MDDYANWTSTPQGWQCPVCKRVYSPTTAMCMFCGNEESKATTYSTPVYRDETHVQKSTSMVELFGKKYPVVGEVVFKEKDDGQKETP